MRTRTGRVNTAQNQRPCARSRKECEIITGSAEVELPRVPDESVAVTVTSPPYYRQKDYGVAGQIGWEPSVTQYIDRLTAILADIRRATRPDGSCFVIIGDSYIKKSLQMIPSRLAIAAVETGWTLRNDLIWAKTDAAPDGASDRWRFTHEHILFLTKRARGYKFNADVIRVPHSPVTLKRWSMGQAYGGKKARSSSGPLGQRFALGRTFKLNPNGAIPRDVIETSTARSPLRHLATFPTALVERFILATTDPYDLVLDCFAGTGTTGLAARQHDRRFIGFELNEDYANVGRQQLAAMQSLSKRAA